MHRNVFILLAHMRQLSMVASVVWHLFLVSLHYEALCITLRFDSVEFISCERESVVCTVTTEPKQTGYDLSFSSSSFLQPVPGSTPLSLSLSLSLFLQARGGGIEGGGWKFCSACVISFVSGHGRLAAHYSDGIIENILVQELLKNMLSYSI